MVKNHTAQTSAEMSRVVLVDRIGDDGIDIEVRATDAERAALAERFDLVSLDLLGAAVKITPASESNGVNMAVHLTADVVQSCVVTLDPVAGHIEETFTLQFLPAEEIPAVTLDVGSELEEGEEAEQIEPIFDNCIDVGEVVAEHLSVFLDPYPRKPGVTLKDRAGELEGIVTIGETESDAEEEKENPFAVLQRLTRTDQANT